MHGQCRVIYILDFAVFRHEHPVGADIYRVFIAEFIQAHKITRTYLIERNGRILFYGCDSAWLPTETWNFMRDKPINTLVLELTCGEIASYDWRIFEHNTPEMLEIMLKMFRKYNRFAPDVKYYVSHMARTLHTDHPSLVKFLEPMGVTPAYDGLQIEI